MAGPSPATPVVEEALDRESFERAWHGDGPTAERAPTVAARTLLTLVRNAPNDFRDRQVYLWVDDEYWGKLKYDIPMTQEIAPGPHRIRVNNTLFTHVLDVTALPGEHVRVRCVNGMPTAGWLMFIVLHATYLRVRLEREA